MFSKCNTQICNLYDFCVLHRINRRKNLMTTTIHFFRMRCSGCIKHVSIVMSLSYKLEAHNLLPKKKKIKYFNIKRVHERELKLMSIPNGNWLFRNRNYSYEVQAILCEIRDTCTAKILVGINTTWLKVIYRFWFLSICLILIS